MISRFNTLGSKCIELDAKERLRIAHDFYRTGEETSFRFDIHETMKKVIILKILFVLIQLNLKEIILKWEIDTEGYYS